jgi:hypothetical protein
MAENRRSLNLWDSSGESAARDYDLVSRAMEDQLRLQNEITSAERERQQALEKTREQQELMGQEGQAAFERMSAGSEKFLSSTASGFRGLFRDLFSGEISSAKDLWDSFCNSIANVFSNMVSKMMSSGLERLLGGLFGSSGGDSALPSFFAGLFHSGGVAGEPASLQMISPLAFAGAPRLHSGLAPDEFPAILQQGELVVPRGQWSTGGRQQAPTIIFNTVNNTASPIDVQQRGAAKWDGEKVVIGIVVKNINENGVLGQMFRQRSR